MARAEQIKQRVWKHRADGLHPGSSNSRDLHFYFLFFKSCDLTEKATVGQHEMQTQTLCKRWQREWTVGHVKQQQHSHTTGFWTLFLSPMCSSRLHPGACTKQQSPSLPHEGQGELYPPSRVYLYSQLWGGSHLSTTNIQGLGETPCCYRMLKALRSYLLHMQQPLSHSPVMTTEDVSGIAGACRHLTKWRLFFYQNFLHDLCLDNT